MLRDYNKTDVIVVGAGPAGISASLYLKRAGFEPTVLYFGESQLEKAKKGFDIFIFDSFVPKSGAKL